MNRIADFRAGWRARADTLESASSKVVEMMKEFGKCVSAMAEWCVHDPPFEAAPLKIDYMAKVMSRRKTEPIDAKLGWSFHAWAGTLEQTFGLTVSVGVTSRWVGNGITLSFPFGVIPDPATSRHLISILVRTWSPEYVAYNGVPNKKVQRFELGELTFLSPATKALLGDLSEQKIRRETFESGVLLTLTSSEIERFYALAKETS